MRWPPSVSFFALLAVVFLAGGHRSWLPREVVVSVGLRAARPVPCQGFYTEAPEEKFVAGKAVTVFATPHGNRARISLPVESLEGLRFDFGTAPGTVRAGPVTVAGRETRALDWREFRVRHDIGRFVVGDDGAVNVEAVGGDPYAVCPEPLGVRGRLRVNAFAIAVLVLAAAFVGTALGAIPGAWRRFASKPRGERTRTTAFLLAAIALVSARMAFSARIPPWFGTSGWDEVWFANAADSLLRGNWLGSYDQYALCKGCFGPMVLAASACLRIPFPLAENLLYVLGCAFFVIVLSRFVRPRWFLLAVFGALLFNPVSYSLDTMQSVYRNGMAAWQVPIVFGCLFMAYRAATRKERGLVPWALASGFALWAFLNTREDGVWLWPFALVCMAVSAIRARAAEATPRARAVRSLSFLLPFAVVLLGNAALCLVNWRVYGVPMRNDRDAGNYARAMRDLYLVAPEPDDEARLSSPEHTGHYHNIYYSTLCRAYEASPTLAGARREIDGAVEEWSRHPRQHGLDLCLDHMLFAIRNGAFDAGHYDSLRASETFFGAVHRELSEAFAAGRLARRGVSFTAMAAPFRPSFVPGILREWRTALARTAAFRGPETILADSKAPGATGARRTVFERTTLCGEPSPEKRPAARAAVVRANAAARVYSACVPWAVGAALAGWAALGICLSLRRFRASDLLDGWLLATGLLGSVLVHTACIAYMSATTFYATRYHYMAATYQMALLFISVVTGLCLENIKRSNRETPVERKSE